MVHRAYIRKEVIFYGNDDIDDNTPIGTEDELSEEQMDYIWELIENNMIQEDEWIEEVD